ncbi:hypothetical protein CCMA1212_000568 [Trichoderma ghanense]|uniref:Uncharacterized protein n=1 Tax=Trichoderma ghanense TaxID=65468 RepID=A0ABY2HHL9_9HYPO
MQNIPLDAQLPQTRSVRSESTTRLFVLGQAAARVEQLIWMRISLNCDEGWCGLVEALHWAYGPSGKMWTAGVRDGQLDLDLDFSWPRISLGRVPDGNEKPMLRPDMQAISTTCSRSTSMYEVL